MKKQMLIDANDFEIKVMENDDICEDCAYEVVNMLDDAPTVDAIPVVRCRDCKYCTIDKTWNCSKSEDEMTWWCENPCFSTGDPLYCVIIKDHENGCIKGERKGGGPDG